MSSSASVGGGGLSSSSALATVSEVEALIAALQASSVEWRDKKFSVAQHMHYARSLCRLQEIVAVVATPRAARTLVDHGLLTQCIAMAMEHASLGMMSWVTARTWEAVLTDLLRRLHQVTGSASSVAHLVKPAWSSIAKLSKTSQSTRTGEVSLLASMRLLAVLLQYCPVELDVLRRHLPHPIHSVSEPLRAGGYALLPWVAVNAKCVSGDGEGRGGSGGGGGSAHVASASSACAYPILSDDLLEYIRKGLADSKEMAVREAATEAVRVMLEAGVRLTEAASHTLLALLVGVCESGRRLSADASIPFVSQQMEQDAGMAMGYLLAFLQSGHVLSSVPQVLERRDVTRWQYVGGPGPTQAERVQAVLLLPNMSRYTQMAMGTAVATLWRLCVSPSAMADALRAFFVLLFPTPGDTRAYMPRILVNALALWARQMPSNQSRAALVYCLRDLLRCTTETRIVLHTALLGLQEVVCTLESTRQVSRGLSEDMKRLVATQPSLSATVAEVMASLATHSPHFRRTLLRQSVAAYKQYAIPSTSDAAASSARGSDGVGGGGDAEEGGEGAFTMTVLLLSRTVLSLPPVLLASMPLMKVLLTAVVCLASVEPPTELRDVDYRQMEHYFLFAAALLRYHRHNLSAFLMEKLESSTRMFVSLLVARAAASPSYLRAASAACSLLLVRGDVRVADTVLCVGLLEGQLLSGPQQPSSGTASGLHASLLGKLKGGVFDLVRETNWSAAATTGQIDLGSLRWTVTQALNTLEEIGAGGNGVGVEVVLADDELFPAVVVPLLGSHRPHMAAATGLPKVLAETGHQAIQLIAWSVRFFNDQDMDFCRDVVRRLAGFVRAPVKASSAASSSASLDDRLGLAAQRPALWNTLCAESAVMEELQRLPQADRQRWVRHAEVAQALEQWRVTALRVAQAPMVDLEERLLAAKVVAHLLHLFDTVDAFTVSALRLTGNAAGPTGSASGGSSGGSGSGSGGGGSGAAGVAAPSPVTGATGGVAGLTAATAEACGTFLILGQAHGAVEQPGTFPIAVSVFAESLRRTGLAGDAARPLVLSTLLGVLNVMEVHVSDVQDTILDALLTALAAPMQSQLSPLTHSLVLAILTELDFSSEPLVSLYAMTARTAMDSGAWHTSTAADVMDGRLQLLADAVSSETHQLQVPARALVLRHLALTALKETTLAVPFYFPDYGNVGAGGGGGGGGGAFAGTSAAATASNSARLAAARRRQGHTFRLPWALADSTAEWIANLAAQCVASAVAGDPTVFTSAQADQSQSAPQSPPPAGYSPKAPLNLLEVSVLIDAAATEEARDTWANVALHMVLTASPAETTAYLQDISKVMQARLADLGQLLQGSGRRRSGPVGASLADGDGTSGGGGVEDDAEDALGVTYGSGELTAQFDDDEEGGGLRSGGAAQKNTRQSADDAAAEVTPICGDVASKVAYMALLVSVCDRHTPDVSSQRASAPSPSSSPSADQARRHSQAKLHRQCLEVAVASVPLVESIPELLESAVALLQQLFQSTTSTATTESAAASPSDGTLSATPSPTAHAKKKLGASAAALAVPSLVQWKIPLVAALKTVVQLSIFDSFPACQLVRRFLECELADDTTTRRVTRGLFLLLMALEHLEAESGRELVSKDAGRVVVTLSAVLELTTQRHWRQSATVATEALGSSAGQAALSVLCQDMCCSVGLANGYDPPADLKVPHSVAPEEGVDAGVLLQAAVQLYERPGVTMGPSLRHTVGCLACLVAATDGSDLAPVARLVTALSQPQQSVIAEVAWQTLEASLVPVATTNNTTNAAVPLGSRSASPLSLDTFGGDNVCLISEEEEQYLLDILSSTTTIPKSAARVDRLIASVLPALPLEQDGEAALPPVSELRVLLTLALQAEAAPAVVARVLQCTHVEALRVDVSPRLVTAAVSYVAHATESAIRTLAEASAAGCVLMERACTLYAHKAAVEGRYATPPLVLSPLGGAEVEVAVVERLREAMVDTFDPRSLVQFMWPRPARALNAVVVCLSVLCVEQKADLIVKAGPAMCHLFLELLQVTQDEEVAHTSSSSSSGGAEEGTVSPLQQRVNVCVALLTTLVKSAPQAELLRVVLQPVGVALMKTVARLHPVEVRAAIQTLGPERALLLRGFMEQSTLSATPSTAS